MQPVCEVPVIHRKRLASSLVVVVADKDEGHGFAKKKNAEFQFYTTVLFMQKYLLGQ